MAPALAVLFLGIVAAIGAASASAFLAGMGGGL